VVGGQGIRIGVLGVLSVALELGVHFASRHEIKGSNSVHALWWWVVRRLVNQESGDSGIRSQEIRESGVRRLGNQEWCGGLRSGEQERSGVPVRSGVHWETAAIYRWGYI
jgi:hypothetical protein